MRKIYTLAMAVLLSSSIGVAGNKFPVHNAKIEADHSMTTSKLVSTRGGAKHAANKTVGITADDITGTYQWACSWVGGNHPNTVELKLVDEETGETEIIGMVPELDLVVKCFFDLEAGTVTIPNDQYLGLDSDKCDTYFYLKDVDGYFVPGKSDKEASVGTISGTRVVFPDYDVWAIGNYDHEATWGFWSLTYYNKLILDQEEVIDEEQAGQWKGVGICTLEDAWITPSFSSEGEQMNPADHLIHAELQQNIENENLYRVWRPYHDENWTLVGENQSKYNGQIVFDISDPDHVIVYPCYYAGYGDAYGEYCVFGALGWQMDPYAGDYTEEDLEKVYNFMEERDMPFDTYKDGVVTINLSMFDLNIYCEQAHVLSGDYVVSKITFPGSSAVDGIDVDTTPVRYFNLQGVEVANPEAGQIVIRRQGDKVAKMMVK